MLKSVKHWATFLCNPEHLGNNSYTPRTLAPSNVHLLAIIRPISPDPKITILCPGNWPFKLIIAWAKPAVYKPAGLVPWILTPWRVLSLHPTAVMSELDLNCFIPKPWTTTVTSYSLSSLVISVTYAFKTMLQPASTACLVSVSEYSGPVNSFPYLLRPKPPWIH